MAISPNGAILVNVGFLETNYCLRRRAGDIAPFSSLATGRACRSWSALRIDGHSETGLMLRSRLAFVAFQQRMDVLKETPDCAAAHVPIALS